MLISSLCRPSPFHYTLNILESIIQHLKKIGFKQYVLPVNTYEIICFDEAICYKVETSRMKDDVGLKSLKSNQCVREQTNGDDIMCTCSSAARHVERWGTRTDKMLQGRSLRCTTLFPSVVRSEWHRTRRHRTVYVLKCADEQKTDKHILDVAFRLHQRAFVTHGPQYFCI